MVLLLAAYVAAVSAAGTCWLPRASWPLRAPRAGIAVWQASMLSVLASAVAAGVILAVPCIQVITDPAMLRGCAMLLRAQYASAGGAAAGVAGGGLALVVLSRLGWVAGSAMAAARSRRARHADALVVVARPGPAPGVRILDDDHPAAYCLPGRRRIVLTTGALRRLDSRQLDAVLAHERAHLSQRHHLMLTFASALTCAFPGIRLFAAGAAQIGYLVEVAADDAAVRRTHRLTLAGALLALAGGRVPAEALGAGGTATAQRIRRLIEPPRPASAARRAATPAVMAAASVLAFAVPAIALIAISRCPAA
jgi:Zn-dependent protease with chaperone function